MNEHVPGSKLAERMLSRPEGATMSELIAATGGPQYNVLKRLKATGRTIRETRDGRQTRYRLLPVAVPEQNLPVSSKGQVTLPKTWRDAIGVGGNGAVRATLQDNAIVLTRKTKTIHDLVGILHRPGMRAVTVEEMDEGIRKAVTARYLSQLAAPEAQVIGIDSNILVRLLTKDDAAQTALAEAFVARRFAGDGPVFINLVVLAEAVWVLETVHEMGRREIAAAVTGILETESLRLEDAEAVRDALTAFTKVGAGLTDIVIAKANRLRGCEATATFDRKAAKVDGFVLLK